MASEGARPRRPSTAALTAKVTAIAVAAALALTGGLAVQMAAGQDPALSPKAKQRSASSSSTSQFDTAPAQVVTRTS
jgi:hypothetical protein